MNHFFGVYFALLYVGQVSRGSSGFAANLEYVDIKTRKAHNLLWACGATGGLRSKVAHWIYVSVVRPSIAFASLVWWPECQMANDKKRLSRVQRIAYLRITWAMRTTPTSAIEALTCLSPLEMVVQGEARSAAHRLWSLGWWSYLHLNRGHGILMRLQQSDPIFNMGVDVMRQHLIFNPNIMLLRWLEKGGLEDLGLLL